MESNGLPGCVHLSGATADILRAAGGYTLEARGPIDVKGKGLMNTFWLRSAEEGNPRAGAAALAVAVEEARKRVQAVRKIDWFDLMVRRRDSVASSGSAAPGEKALKVDVCAGADYYTTAAGSPTGAAAARVGASTPGSSRAARGIQHLSFEDLVGDESD